MVQKKREKVLLGLDICYYNKISNKQRCKRHIKRNDAPSVHKTMTHPRNSIQQFIILNNNSILS